MNEVRAAILSGLYQNLLSAYADKRSAEDRRRAAPRYAVSAEALSAADRAKLLASAPLAVETTTIPLEDDGSVARIEALLREIKLVENLP